MLVVAKPCGTAEVYRDRVRNGEVSVSEQPWISSGIQIEWIARDLPAGIEDLFDNEWDDLQERPAWREWMTSVSEEVKGPMNYLEVSDRDDKQVERRRSGDLDILLPGAILVDAADVPRVCRELIREVLSTRAEMAGVPAPPAV